jgi:hypothetical protein
MGTNANCGELKVFFLYFNNFQYAVFSNYLVFKEC